MNSSHKKEFTKSEAEKIRELIRLKLKSPSDKQKTIRDKIRKIGFYYSDFTTSKDGYTVEDFDALVRSGRIKIIGEGMRAVAVNTSDVGSKLPLKEASSKTESSSEISSNINAGELLSRLAANFFDPLSDFESKIPNCSGVYLICLRKGSALPSIAVEPVYTKFRELNVVYTGVASKSLKTRDYCQHFTGNNAGRSTLRKSIGVLFGYKQVPRDKDPSNGKTKFLEADELQLSKWMRNNLVLFFLPTNDFKLAEEQLITHFNPPINLKGNHHKANLEFRNMLSMLRNAR